MKKSFIILTCVSIIAAFISCDNKSEEEKDLYTPVVPVFSKDDCVKVVHDGDEITVTSLNESHIWEVKPQYLRSEELGVGDYWRMQSTDDMDAQVHWLNVKQTSPDTYNIKIKITDPSDTIRHIQMTAKSYIYNYDDVITFILQ